MEMTKQNVGASADGLERPVKWNAICADTDARYAGRGLLMYSISFCSGQEDLQLTALAGGAGEQWSGLTEFQKGRK